MNAKEALAGWYNGMQTPPSEDDDIFADEVIQHLRAAGLAVVPIDALKQVLLALNGPPHYIRELQAIRSLGNSPIDVLLEAIGHG